MMPPNQWGHQLKNKALRMDQMVQESSQQAKCIEPRVLGRPGLTLALPIHPLSVHSRQHLHLLISAEASLVWRPHQPQALPQALEPGQHRQRTPISQCACGHWSRASTWETFSRLWDIPLTSLNHVRNV